MAHFKKTDSLRYITTPFHPEMGFIFSGYSAMAAKNLFLNQKNKTFPELFILAINLSL
jgi:hypothetical protein